MISELDRYRGEITASHGIAGDYQQDILVAEGLRAPAFRRLLLEELANFFRNGVQRLRLDIIIVVRRKRVRGDFLSAKLHRFLRHLLLAFHQLSRASSGIKQEQIDTPQIDAVPLSKKNTRIVCDIKDQKVIHLLYARDGLIGIRITPSEARDKYVIVVLRAY